MDRNPTDFEVFAFEPNPRWHSRLTKQSKEHGFKFLQYAAWNVDGEMTFYDGGRLDSVGATLYADHKSAHLKDKYVVKTLNMSRWLRENFREEDFIAIRMDIEGAEIPVLRSFVVEGSVSYLDFVFVEDHKEQLPHFAPMYAGIQYIYQGFENVRYCPWPDHDGFLRDPCSKPNYIENGDADSKT